MSEVAYYTAGILLYLVLVTFAFVRTFRRNRGGARGIADEALGTRRFSSALIAILIVEVMLGPSDALTLSQNGYRYGLAWMVFPLGAALAQVVAGLFFVRRIFDQFPGRLSLGDIFAERCGGSARLLVGLVVVAQAIAFAGVLIMASGQLLESLLGIDRFFGMLAAAAIVGAFTSIGGIGGVIDSNKLQALFVGCVALLAGAALVYLLGQASPDALHEVLIRPAFSEDHSLRIGLSMFIAYFFGELLLPAYATRALVARDARAAQNGFLLAALLLFGWYLIITTAGSAGALISPSARGATDDAVLLDIVRATFPPKTVPWYLAGALFAAGLLALIHSTLNAFLNTGAVALARDVVGVFVLDEVHQGWVARRAVLGIATLGVLVALSGDSLVAVLLTGYTIWVPTLLAPFGWILFHPGRPLVPATFWLSVIAGGIAWGCFEYLIQAAIPGILAGFLANLIVLFIGQMTSRGSGRTSALDTSQTAR